MSPPLHVALLHPEIPQNTGNIGRICLGVNAALHLVHPLGFDTSAKAVRRAGLDYWRHVQLREHPSAESFWCWAKGRRLHLMSSHGQRSALEACYRVGDVLLFGCESQGLPAELVRERGALRLPMTGPIRSLNLSNAVAVAVYNALRHVEPETFGGARAGARGPQ